MPVGQINRIAILALLACASSAKSEAYQTYKYDTKGRLVRVCSTTAQSAFLTNYVYDKADNRKNVTIQDSTLVLQSNFGIHSPNGKYYFVMQSDRNLVHYGPNGAVWSSNTYGTGGNVAVLQADGNLVIYGPAGAIWSSVTYGNYCAKLAVQDDGNVVIYSSSGLAIWAINAAGK